MHIIAALHDKIFDCVVEHFSGWDDDRHRYKIVFYNLAHPVALQVDSAFYVMHYIKWFDGERLTFAIDERKAKNTRMSTLYNLMRMVSNKGWVPWYLADEPDVE